MWDKLEVTYEGTNKVKETRINLLVREYELFQMKDGESVEEIFFRQIQEKKEIVAFKETMAEPENEDEVEGGEQDENIAMLSQVVTNMMRRNKNYKRDKSNFRKGRESNETDKNDRRCYECGKFGHVQADCPELKRKFSRNVQMKKAFGAWSDEEESDHEEIANMCFMALSEDEESEELGLMADINDEEDDSRRPRSLLDEGTNEVRTHLCPNCYELQEFIDIALADIERVVNELRKVKREIEREKNDWALKLEVEIERDILQKEVNELRLQSNGLQRTSSSSSVKTDQNVPVRKKITCSFYGKMVIALTIAGTKLELKIILATSIAHLAPTVEHHKKNRKGKWYLDSACSRHMTGDKQLFKSVTKLDGGTVTFGDKSKGNVISVGKVPLSSTYDVDGVYLVDELEYNLLSISQLCDNDYEVRFKKYGWFTEDESDDFSRFTWVIFLSHKDDALKNFEVFYKKVQHEKGYYISTTRSDHGGEFESIAFENFCNDQGISHNFSSPRSPQQNSVVERKNRTLQDIARTMIVKNSLPHHFWAEAFDPKSDEGIFLGNSPSSRAYRVYNKITLYIEESIHVVLIDTNPRPRNEHVPKDEEISCAIKFVILGKDHQSKSANQQTQPAEAPPEDLDLSKQDQSINTEKISTANTPNEWKNEPGYPQKFIIGDPQEGITTRRSQKNKSHAALISQIEPKKVNQTLKDSYWINAMKEELDQFEKNKVWELVSKPQNSSVVGTKWVFKNKLDESGQASFEIKQEWWHKVTLNKKESTMMRPLHLWQDLNPFESYLLLPLKNDSKLYQMDVKSVFLNGYISEEVYVKQPPGFANTLFPIMYTS
ncbi:uncharacterized protein LOC142165378 [Nicotiana tabacum]|uniref:Uncharacterized protein LOC142165378 n=1 Tax=Nicotiana tabacum TaxID=4097 RepID=A0AC58S4X8_TOBAC